MSIGSAAASDKIKEQAQFFERARGGFMSTRPSANVVAVLNALRRAGVEIEDDGLRLWDAVAIVFDFVNPSSTREGDRLRLRAAA